MKRETKYIQLNGGQSTKLQKKIISKNMIFLDYFINFFRDNTNEAKNNPIEVLKNEANAYGKGLYAQIIQISQNDFKFVAENKNENEAKFKFQGQSARSQH